MANNLKMGSGFFIAPQLVVTLVEIERFAR